MNAHRQPNQEFYVNKANRLSYGRFIYPENEEGVLNELEQSLQISDSGKLTEQDIRNNPITQYTINPRQGGSSIWQRLFNQN